MSVKRKVQGGVLGFIGFMLSPLSWWNDLFVNVPLAVAFAWIISLFWPSGFLASAVVGYWLTNVLGFILMHKAAGMMLSRDDKPEPYTKKKLAQDLGVSLAYTALILVLIKLKVLQPVADYFKSP